jgi:predicted nucleotidyltransferase
MPHFDHLRQKRAKILAIADRYGATNLRIFGSGSRGDDRPDSDIDILIDQENARSLFDHVSCFKYPTTNGVTMFNLSESVNRTLNYT